MTQIHEKNIQNQISSELDKDTNQETTNTKFPMIPSQTLEKKQITYCQLTLICMGAINQGKMNSVVFILLHFAFSHIYLSSIKERK